MHISDTSILTACLLNSIIILFVCFLARRDKVIQKVGPGCIIIVMLFTIFRMYVPFEFPYTYALRIKDILNWLMDFLFYPVFSGSIQITIWDIFLMIWSAGAVILFIRNIWIYRRVIRAVSVLPEVSWETIKKRYELSGDYYKGVEKIRISYSNVMSSPCIIGLRHPRLLLPEYDYSSEQLRYILLHELVHVRKKDIAWKILVDLLCTAFWWNPVFYLLKHELFKLIEIRNDMEIASLLSEAEVVDYMESLVKTARMMAGKNMAFIVSFNRSKGSELKRRIQLLSSGAHVARGFQVLAYFLIFMLLFLSSAIIINPSSYKGIEEEGTVLTDVNTYLIINGNQYDVYVDNEYFFTTDDLRPFQGVNIYNNLEEALGNE